MSKLYKISNWKEGLANVYFYCPGCKCDHGVWTIPWVKDYDKNNNPIPGPVWGFNGNMDKPTFSPSILVQSNHGDIREVCHTFVRDGMIQYLGDCTHELAGQTVEIPEK